MKKKIQILKSTLFFFRQGRAALSKQCSHNTAEVSRLEAELREERKRRSKMKIVMQGAAHTLRQALMVTGLLTFISQ